MPSETHRQNVPPVTTLTTDTINQLKQMLAASALARSASRGLRRSAAPALSAHLTAACAAPPHRRLHRCRALPAPPTSESSSFSSTNSSNSSTNAGRESGGSGANQRWEERIISALVVNRPGAFSVVSFPSITPV